MAASAEQAGQQATHAAPQPAEAGSTPGVDRAAVTSWLAAQDVAHTPPLTFEHIAGGRSNLTYRVTDAAGHAWALRRPPTGGVLATAHDMSREWRFLTTLAGSEVPVPAPVAFCDDPRVTGGQFYLMDFADGRVLADEADGALVGEQARQRVAESTADVLVALHAQPVEGTELAGLRRPGNFVERQLRRWHRQVHESAVEDLRVIDEAHRALLADLPGQPDAIAHGDYRAGNIVYAPDGSVVAVLDWELAAIGDPLTDLGWLLASWSEPGDTVPTTTDGPTGAGGYPPRATLIERYAAGSGRDLERLDYYVAFARWRAACIMAGVWTRYQRGVMGDDDYDASTALDRFHRQSEAALVALRG